MDIQPWHTSASRVWQRATATGLSVAPPEGDASRPEARRSAAAALSSVKTSAGTESSLCCEAEEPLPAAALGSVAVSEALSSCAAVSSLVAAQRTAAGSQTPRGEGWAAGNAGTGGWCTCCRTHTVWAPRRANLRASSMVTNGDLVSESGRRTATGHALRRYRTVWHAKETARWA